MPKKQTEVDRAKLEAAILNAESGGPVAGRTALWSAVATLYNGDNPPCAITPSVVYIRFTQWGLTCKTQPGKRGAARFRQSIRQSWLRHDPGHGEAVPKSCQEFWGRKIILRSSG